MTEVELKAWVSDRDSLIKNLDSWAKYAGSVIRDDNYWGLTDRKIRSIRVRRETFDGENKRTLITYKRKELRKKEGTIIEVNDERECTVSDPLPIESFLEDAGFSVILKKHKDVMDWTVDVSGENLPEGLFATLELCRVPPLGDFLEIEILSPTDEPTVIEKLRGMLELYLEKAGIPKEKIEPRYYSELLKNCR